jgi:hypothetical protein
MKCLISLCAFVILITCGRISLVEAQFSPMGEEARVFRDFDLRVMDYEKLRKAAPSLRTTDQGKEIVSRRQTLAQAIRTARPNARQGDIFTPEISAQFITIIRRTLEGPAGSTPRKTIRQGDPVAGVKLSVNAAYPEHLPTTTIPPTLLRRLPELPERIAYRILGRDLLLQDTEARLIIDLIPAALP